MGPGFFGGGGVENILELVVNILKLLKGTL